MIIINNKNFEPFLSADQLTVRISELAAMINQDYAQRNPFFVVVLNGAFMFAADLLKKIEVPCELSFIKLASYHQMSSSGSVKELIGLSRPVAGRDVIIIEDIVDTGLTMSGLVRRIREEDARSVEVLTLLHKPAALRQPIQIKYVGFEIENRFVVGYGLDYDEQGRNLDAIYVLID